ETIQRDLHVQARHACEVAGRFSVSTNFHCDETHVPSPFCARSMSTSGWSLTVARDSSATAGGCRGGRGGLMLDPGVCAGLRGAAQQVSSRGLVPRLSIGTLQLSIRCSSILFLPKRSFPVIALEIRLVSGPLAASDCSCAMAGDGAAITSEA